MSIWPHHFKAERTPRSPLTIIEMIIHWFNVVGGIYVLSPYLILSALGYVSSDKGPVIAQAMTSEIGIILVGILALFFGIMGLYGVYTRSWKIRAQALFGVIMLRIYVILATIGLVGFFPATWLASLCVCFVAAVCYIHDKQMARAVGGKL